MKLLLPGALAAATACMSATATAQPIPIPGFPIGHVTSVSSNQLPRAVTFTIDQESGSCAAGQLWSISGDITLLNATYATLLTAFVTGKRISFVQLGNICGTIPGEGVTIQQ